MSLCKYLLTRQQPLAKQPFARYASVLSHAHVRKQQQQQKEILQRERQEAFRQAAMLPPRKAYVFRQEGPVPRSPQAVDRLEYILGELPLGQKGYYIPRITGQSADNSVAKRQTKELERVVERATNVIDALAEASSKTQKDCALVSEEVNEVANVDKSGAAEKRWASVSAAALGASGVLGFLLAVGSPLVQ